MTEVLTSIPTEAQLEAEREEFIEGNEQKAVELEVARLALRRHDHIDAQVSFDD